MTTNFEKIKAMSIDEMTEFIKRLKTTYCQYKERQNYCYGCIIKDLCGLQLSKTKQWLEQESE